MNNWSVSMISYALFVRRQAMSSLELPVGQFNFSATILAFFLASPGCAKPHGQWVVPLCEIPRWNRPV